MARLQLQLFFRFRSVITIAMLFFASSFSFAQSGISYHGKILRPDGTPVNSANTQFRIQLKSPGAESCLLWEEQQTKDLSQTAGVFSITINDTSEPSLIANTLPFTIERVFSNKTAFTGLSCSSGTSYTPSSSIDGRILQAFFRELPTDPWEQVPVLKINYVPLALNSVQLQGYLPSEFLKIDPYPTQTPISNAGVNTLLGLIAGTSNLYVKPADPLGGDLSGTIGAGSVIGIRGRAVGAAVPLVGQVLKFDGTSWVPSADDTGGAPADASYAAKGVVQFDTSAAVSGISVTAGVARLADTIAAGGPTGGVSTIPVITYDAKGRLTAVATAAVDDVTKLPLAGGTMTGSINMGLQNITNATSVAATNFSGRNLLLSDNDTNVATIRAPVNLVADYALTLPTAAPTNGYVLSTDATGQLSWIPAATGLVTSVTATAPVLSTGGATPVISLDTGLTANKVPQVGGTALGANGVVVANGTATALTSLNCAVNQVIKFDASGFAVCGADDAGAANAFVQNGNAFGAAAVLGTNDNFDLNFETNSSTKMTLSPSGFLGVNTTTPRSFLDIAVPTTDTTSNASITISTHSSTYAQPSLLLLHTRPNLTTGWGDAGVGGWKVGSVSGSGGNGGMESDFTLCSRNGTNSEACRIHIDYGTGNMNLGGTNASVHMGSKVNVAGNMTVGLTWSSYTTEQAAPANSLIVEGSVGIGTATPATRLDVSGAVRIGNDATACAAGLSGSLRYNAGVVEYCNGSAWQAFGVSGAGLTSLNGQTGNTQTFAINYNGTLPFFSSSGNVHELNIPLANTGGAVGAGLISNAEYTTFNSKLTSPLTTKGDLLSRDSTAHVRLPVGTNGQILSANSATATGLEWIAAPVGDITSVVAGAGLVTGGTAGDVTVDVAAGNGIVVAADSVAVDTGLGINKIPQVGGTALGANGVVVANGTATALTSLNCAVNQVIKFDASGFATCGTDDSGAVNAFVQNGNAFGAAAVLGTNDAQSLTLETNNTPRMIMTSTGTTGFLSANQAINTGTSNVAIFSTDSQAANIGGSLGFGGQDGSVSDRTFARISGRKANSTSGNYDGYLSFETRTNGSLPEERMRINQQGNVGIGTTSPAEKLSVVTGLAGQGMSLRSGAAGNRTWMSVGRTSDELQLGVTGAANEFYNGSAAGTSVIRANSTNKIMLGTNGAVPEITLEPGLVGIGTIYPQTHLDLQGSMQFRGISSETIPPTADHGRIYYDLEDKKFKVSENGAAYTDLIPTGGTGDILNGGNTVAAPMTIGSNNNFALNFEVNNTTKMTLDTNNNLSINGGITTNSNGIAVGSSTSSNWYAMAFGHDTVASGAESTTFGFGTIASSLGQMSVGMNNLTTGTETDGSWVATDPLFVIGNGDFLAPRSNALMVYKNARTLFNGGTSTTLPAGNAMMNVKGSTTDNTAAAFNATDSAGSSRLYVRNDGNVGIGTTSPGALLQLGTPGTSPGTMRLSGSASGFVQVQPAAAAGSWTMTLPASAGTNGQVLSTNGSGVTSWITPSGGGSGDINNNGNTFGANATIGTNDNFGLNFETNGTTRISISNTGNFIFGENPGVPGRFILATNSAAPDDDDIFVASASNTATHAPSLVTARFRGTIAAPTSVQVGDSLGGMYITGFDGASSKLAAGVVGYAENTFSTQVSASLRLFTTEGTNTNSKVFIAPNGFVGIGDAMISASSRLEVDGAITQRGMAAPALSSGGQGRIYFDSTSNKFRVSQNGSAYTDLLTSMSGFNANQAIVANGSGVATSFTCSTGQVLGFNASGFAVCTNVTGAGGFVNNGNSYGAAATLGTNDNFALNFETNGSPKMTILGNGNVGIGTTNPLNFFDLHATLTDTTGDTAFGSEVTINPAVNVTQDYYGQGMSLATAGTRNISGVIFQDNNFFLHDSDGDLTEHRGYYSESIHNSSGTVGIMRGGAHYIGNNQNGTVNSATSVWSLVSNNSTGTITDAYGGYFEVLRPSGAITNAYGVYVGDIQGTNRFAFYAEDPAASNYFAGNVGIGTNNSLYPLAVKKDQATLTDLLIENSNTSVGAEAAVRFSTDSGTFRIGKSNLAGVGNAYLYNYDPHGIEFGTNGLERMRIDASGNVGIGTSSPGALLDLNATDGSAITRYNASNVSSGGEIALRVYNTNDATRFGLNLSSTPDNNAIVWENLVGTNQQTMTFSDGIASSNSIFGISSSTNAGVSFEPRFVVTQGGNVGVGTTTPSAKLDITDTSTTTSAIIVPRAGNFTGTNVNGMIRYNTASTLFEFRQNGAWVNYTTVSDSRLKTNVKPVENGLDIINRLNPVFYDWDKNNPKASSFDQKHQIGFIAQEVEKVLPEVVNVGEDSYRSVEYGKIVSVAIAAVKELYLRILKIEENNSDQDRNIASVQSVIAAKDKEIAELKAKALKAERDHAAIKAYICKKDPKSFLCQ